MKTLIKILAVIGGYAALTFVMGLFGGFGVVLGLGWS